MLRRVLRLLKRLLSTQGSVMGQAVTSGIWGVLINVFDRVLRIVMLVILTNLLSPEAFGLVGIGLVTLAAMKTLTEFGLDRALIQNEKEDVDDYFDTTWTLQVGRGILLAGIAFTAAPWLATFFSEPQAADVIRVISFAPLITGFRNPGVVYFQKNLDFDKQFVYLMSSAIAHVGVAIGLGLLLQNVWALVFGILAGRFTKLVVSYLIHDYRPRPGFDPEIAREVLGFGKWILASSVMWFITLQGDDAFVGWLLGAGALGLYQVAYRLSNAPTTEITQVVSSVAFPAYSKVQTDDEKIREGYFKTLQLTSFVTLPATVGIIVLAPRFVQTFMGEEWIAMVVAMQILTIHGGFRALAATFGPLFEAIGRPDYNTKVGAVSVTGLVIAIYPLTNRFGIEGTAMAITLMSVFFPIPLYLVLRAIDGRFRRWLAIVAYPTFGSVVMGASVYALSERLATGHPVVEFVALVLAGIVLYAAVMALVDRQFDYGIEELIRGMAQEIQ